MGHDVATVENGGESGEEALGTELVKKLKQIDEKQKDM